ncbi:formimidoylglutamase [Paeniglutamicibacter psychrophenolicus]|uniref:Formimidoylglutamase n=1 Tax=Paeniglutamicibacter psychrophenolicus TaxID=257454 RepID=A0ABS4W9F6_9MICC|nr:formimidoylglutamase [Paeniglutamicibacter psychrophenolicus]MBP2372837.1 formiminoglutamase [Paeniglutamicibacter psychrophenolicus]
MTWKDAGSWAGRDDGPGAQNARWHSTIKPWKAGEGAGSALLGFASDEGVRRNKGRTGAKTGPGALRAALSNISLHEPANLFDAGDIAVEDRELEAGQEEFANALAGLLRDGQFTVGLGGGHEITFASYSGIAKALGADGHWSLGCLNIDAHFDLRVAETASSGTGFAQIAEAEAAAGRTFRYAAVGISEASNTKVLFDRAAELGVQVLLDTECHLGNIDAVRGFVAEFAGSVDHLYLTIDLDALPASVAPGVSAPAGYGIGLEVVRAIVVAASASGKLIHADIAELNPDFDIDQRTARTGARLVNDLIMNRG